MIVRQARSLWIIGGLLVCSVFLYQNCGPAKLSGEASSPSLEDVSDSPSTVGTKVDLNQLSLAQAELAENLIYPSQGVIRNSTYSVGSPIIENVILKTNDFSRIEWILASTSTVVSNGKVFSSQAFTPEMVGPLLIYGYRDSVPFFIGMVRIFSREPSSVAAPSTGAVQISQRVVSSNTERETLAIEVEAPDVDVTGIQFIRQNSDETANGVRSFSFTKLRSESVNVVISVTDRSGQTLNRTLNFAAQSTTPTVPSLGSIVRIRTRVNNLSVADAPNANNGTRIHLWETVAGNPNQQFVMTASGQVKVHDKCLMPEGSFQGAGAVLADCNGTPGQVWSYDATTGVLKAATGFCLDVAASVMTNGNDISTWTCQGSLNQKWDLVP